MDEFSAVLKARGFVNEVGPTSIPVPVEAYVEHAGAVLRPQTDLGPDEPGWAFMNNGKHYICVNANDRPERQRFTICHEIAHIVLALESLRRLQAQYVGLSHIHLRQQLAPRVWYTGSLSRCDYSEVEDKGYHLFTLTEPEIRPDLSDLQIEFRPSPTRRMVELHALYESGEFRFSESLDPSRLKDSRVKVVVTVGNGVHEALSREEQVELREKLLAANPAELKVKIEHNAETVPDTAPVSVAKIAEEKLRAYWTLKGFPPPDQQERLLARLTQVEHAVLAQIE